MKGRKHWQMLFSALLLLIMAISLGCSSVMFILYYRQFCNKISDNLQLVGESVASSMTDNIFNQAASICNDLMIKSAYDELHVFSVEQPAFKQQQAHSCFKKASAGSSIFAETLLYYPDEQTLMGHFSGIRSLHRRQNQTMYEDLIPVLESIDSARSGQWTVIEDVSFPPANGKLIALVRTMSFWEKRAQKPVAVFVLSTSVIESLMHTYSTEEICLTLCAADGSVFTSTVSADQREGFLPLLDDATEQSWTDQYYVHVRLPLGNTGLSLLISTAHSYYNSATLPLTLFFVALNIGAFLIGILVSYRMANWFYSPIRQLTDAVMDMYSPEAAETADGSESGLVLSAFDAIHKKLTDMGEMFEANLPYLRRVAIHDLFTNSQSVNEHTPELLAASRIHLPYDAYCVVAVRMFRPDMANLDEVERSLVPYALIDRLEGSLQREGAVYGYNEGDRLYFLLNAGGQTLSEALEDMMTALENYTADNGIRMHVAHSDPICELTEISLASQTLEERFLDRFFKEPRSGKVVPDVQPLYKKVTDSIQNEQWDELEALLTKFIEAIDGCLRTDASFLLRQMGLTLLSHLPEATALSRAENEHVINLLFSPQQVLWNIGEYPHALREGIEGVVKSCSQNSRELSELQTKVRDYVLAHMGESISRDDLAAALHFNSSYFSTLFKRQCDMSVSHYITTVKMEFAVSQLLNTMHSVAEISEQIGFSSPQYFIRKFRDQYGLTPLEFRKKQMDS